MKAEFDTVNKIICATDTHQHSNDQLDTSGLYCPEPVMLLHSKIRKMAEGNLVDVIATDPSTWKDIPKFCNFLGHTLLKKEKKANTFYYLIRKGSKCLVPGHEGSD